MKLTREQMLNGMYRRDGSLNGRYLVAVTSTRIYCLPDCPARKPKADNVLFFLSEVDAQEAGFRPCKRCRPQHYYRGVDPERTAIEDLKRRVEGEPSRYADARAVVRESGYGATKLSDLMVTHFHQTIGVLLRRARLKRAMALLTGEQLSPAEAGFAVGYRSLATFYNQFGAFTCLTPAAYRDLPGTETFALRLPRGYRPRGPSSLLARDPESSCQGWEGGRGWKALALGADRFVLEIEIKRSLAICRLHGRDRSLSPAAAPAAHGVALRLLGLVQVRPGERLLLRPPWQPLTAPTGSLHPALYATAFEALCWAIVGQQINIRFASTLIRRLLDLAGPSIDAETVAFPGAEAVARLEPGELTARQFSRAKATALVDISREIAASRLVLDDLAKGSAPAAVERLQSLKGIGPWTSQYVLMRGHGFADCLPVGDAGLSAAMVRYFGLQQRPDNPQMEALAAPFAPHRSLATHYLWAGFAT